jgi:hypothetical protein
LTGISFWDGDAPANHLTWFPNPTEIEPPTGYRIYRRHFGETDAVLLATVGSVLEFLDPSPAPGANYLYTLVPLRGSTAGAAITYPLSTVITP